MAGMAGKRSTYSALPGSLSPHSMDRGDGSGLCVWPDHAFVIRGEKKIRVGMGRHSHRSLRYPAHPEYLWGPGSLVGAGNACVYATLFSEHNEISAVAALFADDPGADVSADIGV